MYTLQFNERTNISENLISYVGFMICDLISQKMLFVKDKFTQKKFKIGICCIMCTVFNSKGDSQI